MTTGDEIDLDRADQPEMAALLERMYRRTTNGDRPRGDRLVLECREHDGPQGLHHGAWVYLKRDRYDRWLLAHFDTRYGEDHAPSRMSDQHRWQQDYWQRAGDHAGYETAQELRVRGVRVDVAIFGPTTTIGIEVQRSALTRASAMQRTNTARKNGITSLWSGDKPSKPPEWAYSVPTVLTNELPDGHSPRGSWTVVNGVRKVVPTKCAFPWFTDSTVEGFGGRCPATKRTRSCGKHHPRFLPRGGLTVDAVAEQAPAGGLVPLRLPWSRKRPTVVYIVTAEDAEAYSELTDGNYADPELTARYASDTARVGAVGPCQAVVEPIAEPSETPVAEQHGSPRSLYPLLSSTPTDLWLVSRTPVEIHNPVTAPMGTCRFCGGSLSEAQIRRGITNHVRCWQEQTRP